MTSEPLRLVVFDVDGTLVDSQAHIHSAMCAAFAELDLAEPSRDAVMHCVGLSLPEAMAQLAPHLSWETRAALSDRYRAASFARHTSAGDDNKALFYPGVRSVLDHLHADDFTLMATATGMSRRGLDRIIAQHDLSGYFQSCQTADTHPSKPHPSMLYAAMNEVGVEPSHTVIIGDTSYDMDMGKAAGVRTLGVTWGNHKPALLRSADRLLDSAEELMSELKSWIGNLS